MELNPAASRQDVKILRVAGVSGVVTNVDVDVVSNHLDASHTGVAAHCAAVCVGVQALTVPLQSLGL